MKPKTLRYLKPKERDILKAIIDWLEAKHILYVRHSPSNVVGRRGEATFRRIRPSQRGAPDLFVFPGDGRTVCPEVKIPGKTLSKDQQIWRSKAESAGIEHRVVCSLDEAIGFICNYWRHLPAP